MVYIVLRTMMSNRFSGWEFYEVYENRALAKAFVDGKNANNNSRYTYRLTTRKPK